MLDQMRKNSRSLLITVLFGIIIVVFIINFGPQSRGSSCEQAMSDDHYAAKVGGQVISNNDFRYGFLLSGGDRYPPKIAKQERLKEMVMDKLIERELLAGMAEKLGFVVTDDEVDDQIGDGKIMTLGGASVPRPDAAEGRALQLRVVQDLRAHPAPADAQRSSSRNRRRRCWRRACANLVRSSVDRLSGRGEGGLRPQEPPDQPRVHPLHQPPPGGRGRARRTRRSPLTPARTKRS